MAKKGWANNAKYNTHSSIVIPGNSAVRKRFNGLQSSETISQGFQEVPFGGMAFAGDSRHIESGSQHRWWQVMEAY